LTQQRYRRRLIVSAVGALAVALWFIAGGDSLSTGSRRLIGQVVAVNDDLSLMVRADDAIRPRRITLAQLRWPDEWRGRAKRRLERQVVNQSVAAVRDGGSPDAMLVYLSDGLLLNEAMCDAGDAQCDEQDAGLLRPWLTRVHRWAKRDGRGLWGETEAQ
jgi:hypothetical protein